MDDMKSGGGGSEEELESGERVWAWWKYIVWNPGSILEIKTKY